MSSATSIRPCQGDAADPYHAEPDDCVNCRHWDWNDDDGKCPGHRWPFLFCTTAVEVARERGETIDYLCDLVNEIARESGAPERVHRAQ